MTKRVLRTGERVAERPSRTPIHEQRDKLALKGIDDPNFVFRVVNDTPGRIDKFLKAGYEIVLTSMYPDANIQLADPTAGQAGQEGSPVKIGVGRGVQGYLMRIPVEWYNEDQLAKELQLQELEEQMVQRAKTETYGKLEINRGSQT